MINPGFTGGKLITCILPKGHAIPLMEKLRKEKNVTNMSFHHARGAGRSGHERRGIGHYVENHILTIATSDADADDVFNFIYHEAKIGEGHNGMIWMEKLGMFTPYILPNEIQEK